MSGTPDDGGPGGRPAGPGGGDGADEGEARSGWGLGDAAVGYLVGLFVSALAATAWTMASGAKDVSLGATAAGLIGLWVGLAGAPLWASRVKGSRRLGPDFGLRIRAVDAPVGIAIGLGCQLIMVPVLYLPFRLFNHHLEEQLGRPAQHLTGLAHGPGIAVLGVLVVVGAPVVEELFFRGLLLRSLARRFGTGWAVPGSALLFGLAHYEPLQLLALLAFGVVLAVLAVRTGRLGPGIFAHAAFNAITVAVLAANH